MNRALSVFIILTMLFALTACGDSNSASADESQADAGHQSLSVSLEDNPADPVQPVENENTPSESESETVRDSAEMGEPEPAGEIVINSALQSPELEEEESAILIAYYSRTGNTEQIAGMIQEQVGGDLFQIVSTTQYPEDYNAVIEQARQEQRDNARPTLTATVENMEDYDVVFIGYPIWHSDTPMAILSFLELYDLSGKTVIPFCTHGSGGAGRSYSSVAASAPGATVLDGIAIQGSAASGAKSQVTQWLDGLEY